MLNAAVNLMTKQVLFKMVLNYILTLDMNVAHDTQEKCMKGRPENKAAYKTVSSVEDTLKVLRDLCQNANEVIEKYYNQKRKAMIFKEG